MRDWGWRAGETGHSEKHMCRGPGASIAKGGASDADAQNDDAILDARTHSTYQIWTLLQMPER